MTDVLGGWALGVLWFAVVVVAGKFAADLRLKAGPDANLGTAAAQRAQEASGLLEGLDPGASGAYSGRR